jgi:hypothetical protein
MLILRILRRANTSTTTTYYIKGVADEVIYSMKMQVTNLELTSPIVNGHLEVGGEKNKSSALLSNLAAVLVASASTCSRSSTNAHIAGSEDVSGFELATPAVGCEAPIVNRAVSVKLRDVRLQSLRVPFRSGR